MTLEQDTLTQAALQFTQAIKAEREATAASLDEERQATLSILAALRRENVARQESVSGQFAIGLLIGGAVGTAIALSFTPLSGLAARQNLNLRWQAAMKAFREAAGASEQQLWDDFRQRLKD